MELSELFNDEGELLSFDLTSVDDEMCFYINLWITVAFADRALTQGQFLDGDPMIEVTINQLLLLTAILGAAHHPRTLVGRGLAMQERMEGIVDCNRGISENLLSSGRSIMNSVHICKMH